MDVTLIYRFKNHLSAWGFFSNHKYFPRFFTAFASSNEWTYIFSLSHFALSLALTWTLPINHIWQPIATVHLPLHRLRTTIISLLMGKSLHTPIFISRGRLGWQATRTQLRALTTHLKYCSALSNLYASNANILNKQRMSGRYTSILHNYPTDCCLLSVIPPEASHPLHLAQICPTFFLFGRASLGGCDAEQPQVSSHSNIKQPRPEKRVMAKKIYGDQGKLCLLCVVVYFLA